MTASYMGEETSDAWPVLAQTGLSDRKQARELNSNHFSSSAVTKYNTIRTIYTMYMVS